MAYRTGIKKVGSDYLICHNKDCIHMGAHQSPSNFYKTRNPMIPYHPFCKDCVNKSVDYNNLETVYEVLKVLDIPFLIELWNMVVVANDGDYLKKYLTAINGYSKAKGLRYNNSIFGEVIKKDGIVQALSNPETSSSEVVLDIDDNIFEEEPEEKEEIDEEEPEPTEIEGGLEDDFLEEEEIIEEEPEPTEIESDLEDDFLKEKPEITEIESALEDDFLEEEEEPEEEIDEEPSEIEAGIDEEFMFTEEEPPVPPVIIPEEEEVIEEEPKEEEITPIKPVEEELIWSDDWHGYYTHRDLVYLDNYYKGLQEDYKIDTINYRDYAKKIAKASLVMDKAYQDVLDGKDKADEAYSKATRNFDSLSKSAQFTANQRTANDVTLGCFGRVFDLVEKHNWIPEHVPTNEDMYDKLLKQFSNIERSIK